MVFHSFRGQMNSYKMEKNKKRHFTGTLGRYPVAFLAGALGFPR
jgi:hypothetical protein